MVRQTAWVVTLEVLGGLILLAVVGCALLAARLASGPLRLDMFADEVARAISEARDGRDATLGGVSLEWSPSERRVNMVGYDLVLFDAGGEVAGRADAADIDVDSAALVRARVEVLGARLRGGALELRQVSPSVWSVAGDPLPPIPEGELPQTPEAWLALANRVAPALIDAAAALDADAAFQRLAFDGFQIDVFSQDGGKLMTLDNASGRFERADGGLMLDVAGRGVGQGLPEGIALDIDVEPGLDDLEAELALAGWSLSALAERLGVRLARLDQLPADTALTLDVSRADGLERIGLIAEAGAGALSALGRDVAIDGVALEAAYDARADTLSVLADDLVSDLFSGDIEVFIETAAAPGPRGREVQIEASGLRANFTPVLEAPVTVERLTLEGAYDLPGRAVVLDAARARIAGADLRAKGELAFPEEDGGPPVAGELVAELTGPVEPSTVAAFWPVRLGAGARRFLVDRVPAGMVDEATARVTLNADAFEEGGLADDALEVVFAARDVEVAFLSDLPPVTGGRGVGTLKGDSLRIEVEEAAFGDWSVTSGLVDFPKFRPKGEIFRIYAEGSGPIRELVQTISDSRLQLEARTGFDPDRLSGQGEGTFELLRPALSDVPFEDVRLSAGGRVRGGGLTQVAAGLDLSEAVATVSLDQDGLTIAGYGELGPAPVQFTWRDGFRDGGAPADLSASAVVTPDLLNRFGMLGRAFLSGEAPVEVQAKTGAGGLREADVAFDLTSARIDLSEIGWLKPAGEPAKATIAFDGAGQGNSASARLEADSALLDGDIRLEEGGRLVSADLRRAFIDARADVSGTIRRGPDGGLSVSLSGPFLDVSSALPDLDALGAAGGFDAAITLDAEVERLRVGETLEMTGARLAMISTEAGLQSFTAAGATAGGAALEAAYRAGESGGALTVDAGDAGFLVGALFGVDFLEGGALDLDGTLGGQGAPSEFDMRITDARLRDAPFLTQILSLASLRGLADTIGGEGVLFSEIDLPLTVAGGRFVVDGGRASGPALGLTVNGFVAPEAGDIAVDGVLVPSFGLNSALGGIPIIGDLVVGRDGEGVFSLTYSVRGTLEKAQVSVNPLSAVAPGIIRRIFENPAQTELPELRPRDPDDPIPSELEPLPPPEEL